MYNIPYVIFLFLGLGLFIFGWVMNIKLDLLDKNDKYDYISLIGILILIITTAFLTFNFIQPYLN